ncbi:MAG: hypothetical protein ACRDT0_13465 [Pseudonocardiaceae bacterium]
MTQAQFTSEALQACRTAAGQAAGPIGGVGDAAATVELSATAFGQLDAAGALSTAVGEFAGKLGTEYEAAEQRLRGVERALDAVEMSVAATEAAARDSFTPSGV